MTYEYQRVFEGRLADELLADGWEPFAVVVVPEYTSPDLYGQGQHHHTTTVCVCFRRQVRLRRDPSGPA